jgi:hypothetical protein
VRELQAWVGGRRCPKAIRGRGIQALPQGRHRAASVDAGQLQLRRAAGAHYGLPYSFAHFISDGEGCAEALELYRQLFKPGLGQRPKPRLRLGAGRRHRGRSLAAVRQPRAARVDRQTGRFGPLLAAEQAVRPTTQPRRRTGGAASSVPGGQRGAGGGAAARAGEALEIEEVVVITWTWDPLAQAPLVRVLAGAAGVT